MYRDDDQLLPTANVQMMTFFSLLQQMLADECDGVTVESKE